MNIMKHLTARYFLQGVGKDQPRGKRKRKMNIYEGLKKCSKLRSVLLLLFSTVVNGIIQLHH